MLENSTKSKENINNDDIKSLLGLAIEAATKTASVALIKDGEILAATTVNGRLNHAETLVPMIDSISRLANVDVKNLDFIGVSKGPGSYTGLRIGISVAKGIARVAGAKIIGISTLESLSENICLAEKALLLPESIRDEILICPMLDARRKHAYCSAYLSSESKRTVIIEPELRSVEDFVLKVNELNKKAIYLGDGSVSHRDIILENADGEYRFVENITATPYATVLASIAYERYKAGEGSAYREFVPDYFRDSQAKRMLNDKDNRL